MCRERPRAHAIMAWMRRCRLRALLSIGAVVSLSAIAAEPAAESPRPGHHRDHGFQNSYVDFEPKGLGALLRWRLDACAGRIAEAAARCRRPPSRPTSPSCTATRLRRPAHGARAQLDRPRDVAAAGRRPQHADRPDVLRARVAARLHRAEAARRPRRRACATCRTSTWCVISHNHYDHLDAASVRALGGAGGRLAAVPRAARPEGVDREAAASTTWSSSTGGSAHAIGAVEFVLTPVQHWSGRALDRSHADAVGRLGDARTGPACFLRRRHRLLEGLRRHPRALRRAPERREGGGFDVALLPIGAYEPRWFMAAAARRSGRGGADPRRPAARSTRSACTGARSS